MKRRIARFIAFLLLAVVLSVSPARAQTAEQPIVHTVIFTNPICTFCRQIVEKDLPPAIQKYGDQLEILIVDVNTAEGNKLYEAALEAYGVPRGVPLLFIGENTLGGVNIVPKFPALVETTLASGGLDWPAIPGLEEYISALEVGATATNPPIQFEKIPTQLATDSSGVVHATLFWMEGCPHCDLVIHNVLPPLQDKYAGRLDIELVEVVSLDDVNHLYALGAAYGLSRDQTGVPMLIIDDHVLTGAEQIPTELPGLIEEYLTAGGMAYPDTSVYYAPLDASQVITSGHPEGYGLAWGVMGFMLAVLFYSLAALLWRKLPLMSEHWTGIAFPLLVLVGLGVAGYLAYVETQSVEAMCGPLGDCNAVQVSPYARLFGILPVGVLGVVGYLLILAAWAWNRLHYDKLIGLALFIMAFLGTLFSIYLTYLELFVIHAICLWCLTSALIITLLLLLSLRAASLTFPNFKQK